MRYAFVSIVGFLIAVAGLFAMIGGAVEKYMSAAPGAILFIGGVVICGLSEVCQILEGIAESLRILGDPEIQPVDNAAPMKKTPAQGTSPPERYILTDPARTKPPAKKS
jgi:hypothetical protein